MFKLGKDEIPYAGAEPVTKFTDPTEEQLKEASEFLNEIAKGDHN